MPPTVLPREGGQTGHPGNPLPPAKVCDFWHVSNVFIFFFFREFKEGVRCEKWVCLGKGKCYRNGDVKGVSRNITINKTLELNPNLSFFFFFSPIPEDWHYVSKQLLCPWEAGSQLSRRGSTAKKTAVPVKK